jgi:tRNA (adenine37-N6)-methyltransferase
MTGPIETFEIRPLGTVVGGRIEAIDDDWDTQEAEIHLDAARFTPDVLAGLTDFSHIDVIFVFDQVDESSVNLGARHPRGNPDWPKVGILAQRAKARPNRLGVTTCRLVSVDGLVLRVRGLDAIAGSPVVDIKPYMREFSPREATTQPAWVNELMAKYWTIEPTTS